MALRLQTLYVDFLKFTQAAASEPCIQLHPHWESTNLEIIKLVWVE